MIDSSSSDRSRRGIFFVIAFLIVIIVTNVTIVAIQRRQDTAALPKFLQTASRVDLQSIESGSPISRQLMTAYYVKENRIAWLSRISSELKAGGWSLYNGHITNARPDIAIYKKTVPAASSTTVAQEQYMIVGSGPIDEQGGFLNPQNKPGLGTTAILTNNDPRYSFGIVCSNCRVDVPLATLKRTRLIHARPLPPTPIVKKGP